MRTTLIAVGVAVLGYGCWLLVSTQEVPDVREGLLWAAAGVALHDAILVPLVLVLGWIARRLLQRPSGRPLRILGAAATVVLVVLGPVTLIAIPVLGRFGAEPGNPTLLGRDYLAGWLAVAVVAVLAATLLALSGLVSEEDRGRSPGGQGSRRR
jgi:hypothetical protein